ncbi:hypothetical protein AAG589_03240 [Isoptericola sp. F-RaC21]|uniref:hypothetical protein n=1 Tax=Isoptericola sp. F-RaC21 TaxID=3141452 RepID=UPI00315BF622
MPISAAQAALLTTDRWSWLTTVLDRWYAAPLEAEHGATDAELEALAERLGTQLPAEVREWFALVAHRLEEVQDLPASLATIDGDSEGVSVWVENQAGWSLVAGFDGRTEVDDADLDLTPSPTAETLHGMTLSDTLVGAWSGQGRGPLGELAPGVRAGVVEDDAPAALHDAYAPLGLPGPPWADPVHGDAGTVLRGGQENDQIEWMTACPEDHDRLAGAFPAIAEDES